MAMSTIPPPPGSNLTDPVRLPSGDLLIGGEWVASSDGNRRDAVDPSTGEVLSTVAMATADDVTAAVGSACDAFEAWRAWPAQQRRDVLFELARLIDVNDLELGVLRSLETGSPLKRKRGRRWPPSGRGTTPVGSTRSKASRPRRTRARRSATRCPSRTG